MRWTAFTGADFEPHPSARRRGRQGPRQRGGARLRHLQRRGHGGRRRQAPAERQQAIRQHSHQPRRRRPPGHTAACRRGEGHGETRGLSTHGGAPRGVGRTEERLGSEGRVEMSVRIDVQRVDAGREILAEADPRRVGMPRHRSTARRIDFGEAAAPLSTDAREGAGNPHAVARRPHDRGAIQCGPPRLKRAGRAIDGGQTHAVRAVHGRELTRQIDRVAVDVQTGGSAARERQRQFPVRPVRDRDDAHGIVAAVRASQRHHDLAAHHAHLGEARRPRAFGHNRSRHRIDRGQTHVGTAEPALHAREEPRAVGGESVDRGVGGIERKRRGPWLELVGIQIDRGEAGARDTAAARELSAEHDAFWHWRHGEHVAAHGGSEGPDGTRARLEGFECLRNAAPVGGDDVRPDANETRGVIR